MEEELDLSTPVERDITSEVEPAAGGVDIAAQAEAELSKMSGADEQQSAEKESTTAWDNPDVVSRLNLNSNNDALTSNAQQIWQENYGIKGNDETSQPISEKAKAEKQASDDDKRADFMERQERESEDRAERRREWMERTHRIGDMEMSGADLDKLIHFMKNPAMKEKIAERLAKKGMDKDEIKKAQKDTEEWAALKEKESKGEKLSAEEKAKVEKLEQQKNVQVYVKEAETVRSERQFSLSQNSERDNLVALKQKDETKRYEAKDNITRKLENVVSESGQETKARGFGVVASGRDASDKLSNVASLSEEFAKYSGENPIQSNSLENKKDSNLTLAAATTRQPAADSFSASL